MGKDLDTQHYTGYHGDQDTLHRCSATTETHSHTTYTITKNFKKLTHYTHYYGYITLHMALLVYRSGGRGHQ